MGARRLRVSVLVVVCAVVGVLVLGSGSVGAFQTHVYEASFGPDGTSGSSFVFPWSLAVDRSNGEIYAAGWVENVRRFSSAHALETFSVGFPTASEQTQLAVDSSSHDLYVSGGGSVVSAYHADGTAADFTAGAYTGTNEITGSEICGVAVDGNGDIYVSEPSSGIRVLEPSGEQVTSTSLFGGCNLAVDSKGNVYVDYPHGGVEKLVPSEYPVNVTTTYFSGGMIDSKASRSVAVDPATNHLLVDETGQVAEYDETGQPLGTFGAGGPTGLSNSVGIATNGASGSAQRVYVSNSEGGTRQIYVYGPAVTLPDVSTEAASGIDPKGSATLNGTVKPDGIELTQCKFEYIEATHYKPSAANPYATGGTAECESPAAREIPTGGETQVHAGISGLTPGVVYDYRLMASNKTVSDKNPPTYGANSELVLPPLPKIEGASTSNVTGESANLSAQIDPGSLETTYHFEYDTSPYAPGEPEGKHGTSIGAGKLPAGAGNVTIGPVHVTALHRDVPYYWRVVATNDAGTTLGADHTFVYDTSGEGLPDGRAYEMVTPPHKNAATALHVAQISEDGSRMISEGFTQCFADAQSCLPVRVALGVPFMFSRSSGGWVTSALSPPASQFAASSFWLASADTGMALFSMPTAPVFEDDFYVRRTDGSFVDIGPTGPPSSGPGVGGWEASGIFASSDFSRVFYQDEGSSWFSDLGGSKTAFEFSGAGNAAPVLVGVSGGPGSTDLISACETTLGSTFKSGNPGIVSADGEVVYFVADPCGAGTGVNAGLSVSVGELFVRIGGARTQAISEPQAPQISGGQGPRSECVSPECVGNTESPPAPAVNPGWRGVSFAGASSDGSRAFFTSEQQLTDQASQGSNNLYESVCVRPCANPAQERRLFDASQGAKAHGGPAVQGAIAISSDGSHVYFVAHGVLDTAANAQGQTASEGADNLYVFEQDADHPSGQVRFVAQLPETDGQQWAKNDDFGPSNVTPDGRFLVFESHGNLSADATRTDGAVQIFRYDAQTGVLVRVSVGEHGFNDNGNAGRGDAGIVSAVRGGVSAGALRSDHTMSHDGSFVFFESPIGLTRGALNNVIIGGSPSNPVFAENVYEWHEGQVYLISDGRDTNLQSGNASTVHLLGSDASGSNVFFITADPLSGLDTDTEIDVYDARVCRSDSPCVSGPPSVLPPCLGEACHGTPAAQTGPPSAGSVSFNGQGNVSGPVTKSVKVKKGKRKRIVKCARGRRRVRGKCVKVKVKVKGRGGKAHRSRSYKGGK